MTPELREELRVLVDDDPTVSAQVHAARVELGLVLALKEVDSLTAKTDTLLHLTNATSAELVSRLVEIRDLKAEADKWKAEAHKQAGLVFSQASAVAPDLKILHDLKVKARECAILTGPGVNVTDALMSLFGYQRIGGKPGDVGGEFVST